MTKKPKEKLIDILSEVYYHKETFGGGYRKIMPLIEAELGFRTEEILQEISKLVKTPLHETDFEEGYRNSLIKLGGIIMKKYPN